MGKQLKISELKRVVNVDTFSKYAKILADADNCDETQLSNVLDELSKKTPSRDVLKQTKLGYILKDLTNRDKSSKEIRDKARRLRDKWKNFHKRLLLAPRYDVKCDKPTNESRTRARESLTNAFTLSDKFDHAKESDKKMILDLEFQIFQCCDTLVNARYNSLVRKCIREINEDSSLREKLISREKSVNEFALKCSLEIRDEDKNSPAKLYPLFNQVSKKGK